MKKSRFLLLSISILVSALRTNAQIVNMESQRYHTDTTGWAGSAGGNFSLSNYGQKVHAVNANAHLQYQTEKSLYLLLGSYGFLKGASQSFIDYGFLHFRYNYKLGKVVRLEAFTQVQENAITKIQSRFLLGAGPRFKIISVPKFRLYGGVIPMLEVEKETNNPKTTTDGRLSNYLSFTFTPNQQTELISTTYYQPLMFRVADYRLLNQTSLKVKASKRISVLFSYNYQFDASPAIGVPTDTYNLSTGFELSFN